MPLIDLVEKPSDLGHWQDRRVTVTFGGVLSEQRLQVRKLPLKIELESIWQSQGNPVTKIVQILVRNTGEGPFRLPVGRDADLTLKPGNRDRHELWFSLKAPKEKEPVLPGSMTYSSTDVPGSFMVLAPGGVVRVRYTVDSGLKNGTWARNDPRGVEVQAGCIDNPYEDNPQGYILHSPTPEAFSENMLGLKPE